MKNTGSRKLIDALNTDYLSDSGNAKNLKKTTIWNYRSTVSSFSKYLGRDALLDDLNDETLGAFSTWSVRNGGSIRTTERRCRTLTSLLRWFVNRGDIPPLIGVPPKAVQNDDRFASKVSHGDMKLRDYVRRVVPELKPGIRKYHLHEMERAADAFCEWLHYDIDVGDVLPEHVSDFARVADPSWFGSRLKSVMRTYDPVTFRARQDMTANRVEVDRGNGSSFLLGNVYLDQYEPRVLRTRRQNTKRLYKTTLRVFDMYLGRPATLDDLNDDTVSKFATWRLLTVSKSSVNKDLFNLLAIWRWCNRKGMVEEWPDVQMEKPEKRTPVAWSEKQMRQLYTTVGSLEGRVGRFRRRDWWGALILLLWDTGERIGAVLALTWDAVDLNERWVRFAAENRKGGREDSPARISRETVAALRKLRSDPQNIFEWPYSKTHLWHAYSRILKAAGLPTDAKSKFHRIRKSVASHAEAAGGNATAMLRHSKREITEAYLDPKIVNRQQAVDVLFRLTN